MYYDYAFPQFVILDLYTALDLLAPLNTFSHSVVAVELGYPAVRFLEISSDYILDCSQLSHLHICPPAVMSEILASVRRHKLKKISKNRFSFAVKYPDMKHIKERRFPLHVYCFRGKVYRTKSIDSVADASRLTALPTQFID